MCTVSFIRVKDSVIITSNRDEHINRETAAAPDFLLLDRPSDSIRRKIIFPRDAKAGGTWFVASDSGNIAILLNGAISKHTAAPPYRKSRGLILLDIISGENPYSFFMEMDLQKIEPFTVVLFESGILYELKWDGISKYETRLNSENNFIWSSVTLYSDKVIAEREKRFAQFLTNQKELTAGLIHDFHNNSYGDKENGFIINRNTGIKTFSITQAIVGKNLIDFIHTDLLQHRQFKEMMPINPKEQQ